MFDYKHNYTQLHLFYICAYLSTIISFHSYMLSIDSLILPPYQPVYVIYVERLGNYVHRTFIFTFSTLLFLKKFFWHMVLSNKDIFKHIYLTHRVLTGATTPSQSRPGSNGVFQFPRTVVSLSHLLSYTRYSFDGNILPHSRRDSQRILSPTMHCWKL